MSCKSFRSRDMNVEREIASFLDKHLYSDDAFSRKDRTDSFEEQMKGSDIIISMPKEGKLLLMKKLTFFTKFLLIY